VRTLNPTILFFLYFGSIITPPDTANDRQLHPLETFKIATNLGHPQLFRGAVFVSRFLAFAHARKERRTLWQSVESDPSPNALTMFRRGFVHREIVGRRHPAKVDGAWVD
jgi:hypothetical protein